MTHPKKSPRLIAVAPVATRQSAIRDIKRTLILEAALTVFARDGLENASMRAIGEAAGYMAAAIYFHFESKEAIYGALLDQSLDRLIAQVQGAAGRMHDARRRLDASALAFFDFYNSNPRDLDLGFYLFRGGMRPRGLTREMDARLNAKLLQSLAPVTEAAVALGASRSAARQATADVFAHAVGLLVLHHTGRSRLFAVDPRKLMKAYVETLRRTLTRPTNTGGPDVT